MSNHQRGVAISTTYRLSVPERELVKIRTGLLAQAAIGRLTDLERTALRLANDLHLFRQLARQITTSEFLELAPFSDCDVDEVERVS